MSPKKRSPRNAKSKRGRGFDNPPVELGKEYEVDITETSPIGEGIARIKGFSIFIVNAKLGDHVKVKVNRLDSVCADAEIVAHT
jgi:predicted RNA-binding protein with TRAM domain